MANENGRTCYAFGNCYLVYYAASNQEAWKYGQDDDVACRSGRVRASVCEVVMMEKNNFAVRLLYGTRAGRAFLEWILKSNIDKVIVKFLWSPLSKPVIPVYIKMNKIPMKEFQGQRYRTFREFFVRKRKPVKMDQHPSHLISPCDGWMSAFPIEADSSFCIKGSRYRLQDLIQDQELAKQFYDGDCLIFRLCASDYHHYSYIEQSIHHYY